MLTTIAETESNLRSKRSRSQAKKPEIQEEAGEHIGNGLAQLEDEAEDNEDEGETLKYGTKSILDLS